MLLLYFCAVSLSLSLPLHAGLKVMLVGSGGKAFRMEPAAFLDAVGGKPFFPSFSPQGCFRSIRTGLPRGGAVGPKRREWVTSSKAHLVTKANRHNGEKWARCHKGEFFLCPTNPNLSSFAKNAEGVNPL